jgi:hypothetical protein
MMQSRETWLRDNIGLNILHSGGREYSRWQVYIHGQYHLKQENGNGEEDSGEDMAHK